MSPTHILTTANTAQDFTGLVSTDRSGNNRKSETLTNFFSYYGFHSDAASGAWGDVSMQWTPALGGHFVLTAFNLRGNNQLYLAVSKGSNPDPTDQGQWNTYHYTAPGDRWPVLVTSDKVFIDSYYNGQTFGIASLYDLVQGATGGSGASYDLAQSPTNVFRILNVNMQHVHPAEPQGNAAGTTISNGYFVGSDNNCFTRYIYSGPVATGTFDGGANIGCDSRRAVEPISLAIPGGYINSPLVGTESQNAVLYKEVGGNLIIATGGNYACSNDPANWCYFVNIYDTNNNTYSTQGFQDTGGSMTYGAVGIDSGLRPVVFYSYAANNSVPIAAVMSSRFNYVIGSPTVSSLQGGERERWGDYFDVQMDTQDESRLVGMSTAQSGPSSFGWTTHFTTISPSAS